MPAPCAPARLDLRLPRAAALASAPRERRRGADGARASPASRSRCCLVVPAVLAAAAAASATSPRRPQTPAPPLATPTGPAPSRHAPRSPGVRRGFLGRLRLFARSGRSKLAGATLPAGCGQTKGEGSSSQSGDASFKNSSRLRILRSGPSPRLAPQGQLLPRAGTARLRHRRRRAEGRGDLLLPHPFPLRGPLCPEP